MDKDTFKPARYRKRPVVIEAVQLTLENRAEVYRWMQGRASLRLFDPSGRERPSLDISTLEGIFPAYPGDWIIRGVKGEYYPCRDDIFRLTYEEVEP